MTVDPYPGRDLHRRGHARRPASDPHGALAGLRGASCRTPTTAPPGFFGHGEIVVRHDERAVAVPRSAVTTFAGVTKLFVVEDGTAREREVTLGVDLGDGWVEVTHGVRAACRSPPAGSRKLADGTPSTVAPTQPPGA